MFFLTTLLTNLYIKGGTFLICRKHFQERIILLRGEVLGPQIKLKNRRFFIDVSAPNLNQASKR
jgi:hypothetical protein